MATNGNGSNGHDGGKGEEARPFDERVREIAAPFMNNVQDALDRQAAFFKSVCDLAEEAGASYLKAVDKLGHGITARLREQDHEIEALKRRLDAVEARQAETARPEP